MYFYFYLFYSYTVCSRPAGIKKISYFSDTQSKDVFQSTPVACQSTRIQHTGVSVLSATNEENAMPGRRT